MLQENAEKTAIYHKLRHLHDRHMTRFVNTDVSSICKYMRPPSPTRFPSLHGSTHKLLFLHLRMLAGGVSCLIECIALGARGHKVTPGVADQAGPCGEAPFG